MGWKGKTMLIVKRNQKFVFKTTIIYKYTKIITLHENYMISNDY